MFDPLAHGAIPRIKQMSVNKSGAFNPLEHGAILRKSNQAVRAEDNALGVIGKSFNRGAASILDLPQTALSLAEPVINAPGKLYSAISGNAQPYDFDYISKLKPLSQTVSDVSSNLGYEGFSEPVINQNNFGKKILGSAAETAGAFIGGGAGGRALQSLGAIRAGKFLGSPSSGKELSSLAKSGAALGASAGTLEEAGVNPLLAEALGAPLINAGGSSLLSRFSKANRNALSKQKVADTFTAQMGGKDAVNEAISSVENYKKNPNSLVNPITPEIVDNVGLARIYQAKGLNSTALAERAMENNQKLVGTLEELGKTGLEESALGSSIRESIFEKFKRKKALRAKVTAPLYEKLRTSKEGVVPAESLKLLKQEIKEAGPDSKKSLEKYLKALEATNLTKEETNRFNVLSKELNSINSEYGFLSPEALAQIKAPVEAELSFLAKKSQLSPIQLENTIQELGDKVNAAKIQGKSDEALKYGKIKSAATDDLSKNKEGLAHRQMYKRASLPINEIEKTPLLNNFVKENKDYRKLDGFVLSDEKIPSEILRADLTNTKKLVEQVKHNKERLSLVKGVYVDELLRKATNVSSDLSFDKVKKFVYDKKNNEKIKAIFSPDEVKKLESVVDALQRRQKALGAGKMGGSHTAQLLKIDQELNSSLSNVKDWMIDLTAKASGTGSFGKKAINFGLDKFNKIKNGNKERIIEEALLSPDAFADLFNNKPKSLLSNFKQISKENARKAAIPSLVQLNQDN